ncbi:MAG: diaminopimelate decarboxylase [bacterium]|nr:diaminopimelate decarboxylase [bacterium]
MDHFSFVGQELHAEDVSINKIAHEFGTPCYVYSRATLERHWHVYDSAFANHPHLICYAVKANSNLAVLDLMARLSSGFDIVSGGELARVIEAGGDPAKVVFSGVGKTATEMRAALEAGIFCFNVESESELETLSRVAEESGKVAPVSLRVNPDVDAKTHPYVTTGLRKNKFGIPMSRAEAAYCRAAELPSLEPCGIDCHIGSQLIELPPFLDALDRLLVLVDQLAESGIVLTHLDLGGGLGVSYGREDPPHPSEYAAALLKRLGNRSLKLLVEPGRTIVGNAGILVTRVLYIKQGEDRWFAVVDAAMNDLLRPSLYGAWHEIVPVKKRDGSPQTYDVVGPVCETADFLGKDRELVIAEGDLLVVRTAGAYGFTLASNYNSRPRPAEIMIDGSDIHGIRDREPVEDLWRSEQLLP